MTEGIYEYDFRSTEPTPADMDLIYRILKKLHDSFPGHRWEIEYNSEKAGGVIHIINPALNAALWMTNKTYGYTLHLRTVYMDPDLKCVMRAGGEILERLYLTRGYARDGDEITKIDGVPDANQPEREKEFKKWQSEIAFIESEPKNKLVV